MTAVSIVMSAQLHVPALRMLYPGYPKALHIYLKIKDKRKSINRIHLQAQDRRKVLRTKVAKKLGIKLALKSKGISRMNPPLGGMGGRKKKKVKVNENVTNDSKIINEEGSTIYYIYFITILAHGPFCPGQVSKA